MNQGFFSVCLSDRSGIVHAKIEKLQRHTKLKLLNFNQVATEVLIQGLSEKT